jgi:hypothetical protein
MCELGDAVVISKSGLTGVVDRMARAGLVERIADPDDRRVTSSPSPRPARSSAHAPAATIGRWSPSGSSTGSIRPTST